ncbi:hypothetical protein FRB95_005660 [Tulasnella sp. JGI-2019a]|nr:hypothetical protein FRB95_005660 [Tulasnella sp. JGI-2019a]
MSTLLESVPEADFNTKPQPALPPPTPGSLRFVNSLISEAEGETTSDTDLPSPGITQAARSRPPRPPQPPVPTGRPQTAPHTSTPSRDVAISTLISTALARQSVASSSSAYDSPITSYSRFSTSFTTTRPPLAPQDSSSSSDPSSSLAYLTPSPDPGFLHTPEKNKSNSRMMRSSEIALPFSPGFLGSSSNQHSSFVSSHRASHAAGGGANGPMRVDSPTLPMDFEPMQVAAMVLAEMEKGKDAVRRSVHMEGTMTPSSNVAVRGLDLGVDGLLRAPSAISFAPSRSSTSEVRSGEGVQLFSGEAVGSGVHRPPLLHLNSATRSSTSEVRSAEGRTISGNPIIGISGNLNLNPTPQRPTLLPTSSSPASSPPSPLPPSSATSSQSKHSNGSGGGVAVNVTVTSANNSRSPTPLDHSTSAKLALRTRSSVSAEQPTFFPRFDDVRENTNVGGNNSVTNDNRDGAESPFLGAGGRDSSSTQGSNWMRLAQMQMASRPVVTIPASASAHASPTSGTPALVHSPSVSTVSSRGSSNRLSTPLDVTDALIMGLALRGSSTTGLGELEEEREDEAEAVQDTREQPRHAYATAVPVNVPPPPTMPVRRPSVASTMLPMSPMPTVASSRTTSDSTVTGGSRSSASASGTGRSPDAAVLVMNDGPDGVVVTNVAYKRNSFSKPPRRAPTPTSGRRAFGSESSSGPESPAHASATPPAVEMIKNEALNRPGRSSPSAWSPRPGSKLSRDRSASDASLVPPPPASAPSSSKPRMHRGRSESESVVSPISAPDFPRNPDSLFPSQQSVVHRNKSDPNLQSMNGKGKEVDRSQQTPVESAVAEDKILPRRKGTLLTLPTAGKVVAPNAAPSPVGFPMTARPYSLTSSDNHHDAQFLTFAVPETPSPSLPAVSEPRAEESSVSPSQPSPHRKPPTPRSSASTSRKPRSGREGNLKFTGSPVTAQPSQSPISVPSFERVPIPWKGLTIDAAKWTLSSDELQAIVSRAIRQSAEASTTRILSPDVLDSQIPAETERLEAVQSDIKTRYTFQMRRRKLLLRSLALHMEGADVEKAKKLTEELVESGDICDRLSQELFQVSDQLAQMTQLVQKHTSSALSMGLRKLNTSFVKAKGESIDMQLQLAMLEAERDEAWGLAETLEKELNQCKKQARRSAMIEIVEADTNTNTDGNADTNLLSPTALRAPVLWASGPSSVSASRSSRSSRVSSARTNSVRASKASLRLSLKKGHRLSSASGNQRFSIVNTPGGTKRSSHGSITISRPTSTQSTMATYHFVVPPVPPLPSNGNRRESHGSPSRPVSMSIAATPTTSSSQSQARALAQIQNQLYEMLGIPSPNAHMSPFGGMFELGSPASTSPMRRRSLSFPGSPNPWDEGINQSRRMSVQGPLYHHQSLLESPQVITTMLNSMPSD